MLYWSYFFVSSTVPGRSGEGSIHKAGCLLLFSDVQFSFLFCRLCMHTCSYCISLLNKRGASSEHAIANFVSVLLSRRGKLSYNG